jgi:hypothetical protein
MTTIDVDRLFVLELTRDASRTLSIPGGPRGGRSVASVAEGRFHGERLSGRLADVAAGDWPTFGDDGSFRIDARLALITDDDVPILMTYTGVGGFDEQRNAWMRAAPLFEVGPGPYAWLNNVQGVAHGRLDGDLVVYEVYALR